MRTTDLRFDELHSLSREIYEEYFDVMPISEDQKTDRVLIAMALEDRFIEILSLAEIRQKQDKPWLGEIIELFTLAFLAVANRRVDDDEIRAKAERFGQEVGLSTFAHQGEEYFTSADRAINMSATEANAIMCYGELADAIKRGCTVKTWVTANSQMLLSEDVPSKLGRPFWMVERGSGITKKMVSPFRLLNLLRSVGNCLCIPLMTL